jgi:hypothetical protein
MYCKQWEFSRMVLWRRISMERRQYDLSRFFGLF